MASASIVSTKKGIRKKLEAALTNANSSQIFLTRIAYPMYISRQSKRWMTENESEGAKWTPLNEKYAKWKKLNFVGYPGHGEKLLIRTGRLAEAVIGRKLKGDVISEESAKAGDLPANHHVMITNRELHVYTDLKYAQHVNKTRSIFTFKDDFRKRIKAAYGAWVFGKIKDK